MMYPEDAGQEGKDITEGQKHANGRRGERVGRCESWGLVYFLSRSTIRFLAVSDAGPLQRRSGQNWNFHWTVQTYQGLQES